MSPQIESTGFSMSVKRHRLARGWSQEDLAAASGLSTRTIQRIETGNKPGLETQKSLAAAFETDVESLHEDNSVIHATKDERAANIRGLYLHVWVFALVMPVLVGVNYFATGGPIWVHWVAIFWLLGLVLHVVTVRVMYGPLSEP